MGRSPIDWVPPGAWLTPGYAEWAPPAALRGAVACLWARVSPAGAGQSDRTAQPGLVLPDACSDLIWERGVGGYVAGPDTRPARPTLQPPSSAEVKNHTQLLLGAVRSRFQVPTTVRDAPERLFSVFKRLKQHQRLKQHN